MSSLPGFKSKIVTWKRKQKVPTQKPTMCERLLSVHRLVQRVMSGERWWVRKTRGAPLRRKTEVQTAIMTDRGSGGSRSGDEGCVEEKRERFSTSLVIYSLHLILTELRPGPTLENLLRLVNIEYSVHGQRDLLQPGRVFVKEGTLMKVSRKSRQPRHLFLMNDVLLYTYPQQDGKYRLKNTLPLIGLKVSKPIIENVQNALKIEGTDVSITLSASSFIEREDWFYTLSRAVTEHTRGSVSSCSGEARDRLHLSLGEKAPTLVPVSQVMMCMNCTSDFSLTLRKHHCHGCGRIVCRSCSRNRYPLKYMKDRMAKVCDHCYNELKKRGADVSVLTGKNSPRLNRSSRPLSAVFQNIHPPNIWRHRKGTVTFNQVTVSEEGSISGSLQRSKRSKRNWKRLWFLLKDKVLYTYRAQEEKVASESLPLLGFTVKLPDKQEGEEEANVFQLYHKNTLYYTFKAQDNYTAQRWVNAMEEATVL
ncbi:FYVE, RhoGEF and PH domain-containing protein 5-like isoform X1 [Lates japonicus]|uniref:FYVE, RhoGEF and PH domain-containing protein 5-like isoform X1 n=1 Tax=Lates japonicus TaxID=270547 RepID=A0AAD3N3P5_LATJO|nr:FYVE, RhoGEF and PH domain-containing protein 5-like isoform X1 [Lates japonicus]